MWWPSSDELKQANIETAIAQSNDFALSGAPHELDQDKFETGLLKVATIAAIKKAEPDTYAKILADMTEAVRLGKSQAELHAAIMPYVTNMTKKYLPVASETAVIEMMKVTTAEIDAIRSKDPEACYRFINPRPGEPSVFIGDYISVELGSQDIAASAAVIETGSSKPQQIPAEAVVSDLMDTVLHRLSKKYDAEDIAALSDLNSPTVDRRRVCAVVSGLYREVLMLPIPEQARLLRYMFSQRKYPQLLLLLDGNLKHFSDDARSWVRVFRWDWFNTMPVVPVSVWTTSRGLPRQPATATTPSNPLMNALWPKHRDERDVSQSPVAFMPEHMSAF